MVILKLISLSNKPRQQSDIFGWKLTFILKSSNIDKLSCTYRHSFNVYAFQKVKSVAIQHLYKTAINITNYDVKPN